MIARRLSPLVAVRSSLASVGKVMAFGCTVVSTVTRLRSALQNGLALRQQQALGPQQLQLVAKSLAPLGSVPSARAGRRAERTLRLKYWKYGAFGQARTHPLKG
ncbi:hypothetical protein A5906_05300 [Bradyrhizobium sacchari]|nr:hypothetical protein A5906_05300 [Bradyrhizobium sacchari]